MVRKIGRIEEIEIIVKAVLAGVSPVEGLEGVANLPPEPKVPTDKKKIPLPPSHNDWSR